MRASNGNELYTTHALIVEGLAEAIRALIKARRRHVLPALIRLLGGQCILLEVFVQLPCFRGNEGVFGSRSDRGRLVRQGRRGHRRSRVDLPLLRTGHFIPTATSLGRLDGLKLLNFEVEVHEPAYLFSEVFDLYEAVFLDFLHANLRRTEPHLEGSHQLLP